MGFGFEGLTSGQKFGMASLSVGDLVLVGGAALSVAAPTIDSSDYGSLQFTMPTPQGGEGTYDNYSLVLSLGHSSQSSRTITLSSATGTGAITVLDSAGKFTTGTSGAVTGTMDSFALDSKICDLYGDISAVLSVDDDTSTASSLAATVDDYALFTVAMTQDGTGGGNSTFDPVFAYGNTSTHVPVWSGEVTATALSVSVASASIASGDVDVEVCQWACTSISCERDGLSVLDVSGLKSLASLTCYTNSISVLDVSALTSLTSLNCAINSISVLDVAALTSLTYLNCYNNSISVLDVSALTSITSLTCYTNNISVLDVSALTSMTYLKCHANNISVLDASALASITSLYVYNNSISTANIATILSDLAALTTSGTSKTLQLQNQSPAGNVDIATQACTDINYLADNNWTVTYSGTCVIT